MIPGKDACCVLLYGFIGEYEDVRATDIVRELLEAAAVYKKIDVRINSLGGEVYTGIAIFNALRNCPAEITVYVDGVAASIASVVAMCGKPVYMSRYARLMLHSVTGGCYGRKDELQKCAEMIEQLETTLCTIYAEKTGKDEEEIRAAYFDGQDHWLTASEALELGFIDGIYDAEPVPEDSTPEQIYNIYQNRLQNNEPNHSTMIEKLKKRPGFANCATEEDVLRHVDELERQAANAATLRTENDTLKAENETYKAQEQAARDAADEKLLQEALDAGKIGAPDMPVYRAALKGTERKATLETLGSLPAKRRITDVIGNPTPGDGQSAWEQRMAEIENRVKNK